MHSFQKSKNFVIDPFALQPSSRHSSKARVTSGNLFQLTPPHHGHVSCPSWPQHSLLPHKLLLAPRNTHRIVMSTNTAPRNHSTYLQPPTPSIAKPFILLPLYIYPGPGAWDPLYSAADAHPELEFWVIVNPANGPGAGALPDANYVDALVRLTALQNVKVIGYVHCSYGKRLAEDIVADVEAYGRWEGEMNAMGEEGKVS